MVTSRPRSRANIEEVQVPSPNGEGLVALPRAWSRPVVRAIRPEVDSGRRPAKTTVGELLAVEADAFVDGHDSLWCELRYRHELGTSWTTIQMQKSFDDRWHGMLPITERGMYRFFVRARVDEFATWRDDLAARAGAGQNLSVELQTGADLIDAAAMRARSNERRMLVELAGALLDAPRSLESDVTPEMATWALGESPRGDCSLADVLFSDRLGHLLGTLADPAKGTSSDTRTVVAESAKARFSAWYELFPRSA
jgi:starch synthase (maltosyl-transferring)